MDDYEQMAIDQRMWAEEHRSDQCPGCCDTGITTDRRYNDEGYVTVDVPCFCPIGRYISGPDGLDSLDDSPPRWHVRAALIRSQRRV